MNDPLADTAIRDYYDVKDKGTEFHLFCKICKAGFSLKKTSNHPGNLLSLLNHYRGCEDARDKNQTSK